MSPFRLMIVQEVRTCHKEPLVYYRLSEPRFLGHLYCIIHCLVLSLQKSAFVRVFAVDAQGHELLVRFVEADPLEFVKGRPDDPKFELVRHLFKWH